MAVLHKDGEVIDVVLTKKTTVGDIIPLKNRCGVALGNGVAGDTIAVAMTKTYHDVAKAEDVIEVGDFVYWDGSEVTVTEEGNTYLGVALDPKEAGATDVLFKLNG